MHVTVSIVSYRTADLLQECIDSVVRYVPDLARIAIVVHDDVRVTITAPVPVSMTTEPNRGFGAGHNRAVSGASGGELFLFLNPDARLTQDIAPLCAHFTDPTVAAVGPRLTEAAGRIDQYAAGRHPSLWGIIANHIRTPHLPTVPTAVDWVSGAAMLVRADAFAAIDGFDEGYFLYYEDIDLCHRLRGAGGRILYDPSVTVLHTGGASFPDRATQKRHYDAGQDRYFRTYHSRLHATAQHVLRTLWRLMA